MKHKRIIIIAIAALIAGFFYHNSFNAFCAFTAGAYFYETIEGYFKKN